MRREVRILLVGDDGVGKSTLITSLIKEQFVPNIQHVVPEVTIPPEVTPENVTTHIVDSSARPENRDKLETEIRKANVICIVYSVDEPGSFERLSSHWLPSIKSLGVNVPIVLVGNKIDIRGEDVTNNMLEEEILPIMTEFKEVETCVECSAKQSLNISEVFYFAQKAVLHPTAPSLKRIFRLCDLDKNGALSDDELNEFQKKCFDAPLQQQELDGVKEVVFENDPDGLSSDGLTESGFLYLHTLFIQKGRLETTWTVLRKFGYGEDLSLREEFLRPPMDVPEGSRVELSSAGHAFFTDLFRSHDLDKDGALNDDELNALFSTSPGNPWTSGGFPDSALTTEIGALTLQGFLSQWAMTTLIDYHTTSPISRTWLAKSRSLRLPSSRRGASGRTTFLCAVFGAAGSGKTSLLRRLVKKPFLDVYTQTTRPLSVVNAVEVKGSDIYLVLQEFGSKYESDILSNRKRLEHCDVACFVYDSSDVNSFAYVANLIVLPCVIVATKSDLDLVQQRYDIPPDVFCRNLGLDKPMHISVKDDIMADFFNVLAAVAMNPYGMNAMPKLTSSNSEVRPYPKYVAVTAAVGAFLAVGFLSWRMWKSGEIFRR
ncbi:P-loop containing nucleoside triphosphate hydrolase protein [Catenaria anguillulae PL171]|uniref:Mitochondrial Rho GTPase n=1 Tax=Catenaria anguillulae PL171 TaxID=765915 RepID=A0A1Y2H3U4_9FUNG|nr:P-loop containing nucleoside triphosphate hydrolase protein [Catenaria anguillulae PL171]